jgi:hypothetical protein
MRAASCAVGFVTAWLAAQDALAQTAPFPDNPGSSGSSLHIGPVARLPPPDVHRHDGLYFRYAIGPSYLEATGSGPHGSFATGQVGIGEVLALGGTPAAGLVVAATGAVHLANPEVNGTGVVLFALSDGVLVDWFPDPGGGWHVAAALGLGVTGYDDARGYTVGASLMGGYDFWVAPQWSLGALVVASSMPSVSMQGGAALGAGDLMPAALAIEASVLCH